MTKLNLAFGLSGAATLIYEVVWARQLQLVFGSTIHTASIILASFLSGFAIGSYWFKDKESSKKLFTSLQLIIGVYAILFSLLIPTLIVFLSPLKLGALKFILAFVLVSPPAVIMGATWPVGIGLVKGKGNLGKDAGVLYGANSLGAGLGALASGFVFIPILGLLRTTVLGALLNFASGAVIYFGGEKNG